MDVFERIFIVNEGDSGLRIDTYISRRLKNSRAQAKSFILEGYVKLNGEKPKPSATIKEGDEIHIFIKNPHNEIEKEWPAYKPKIDIIYEDDFIIVINKPAGITVHPTVDERKKTMVNILLSHSKQLANLPDPTRRGVVHRLDKDTTGCVVFAKTDEILLNLKHQFKMRYVKKKYYAIARGVMRRKYYEINAPIRRHPINRQKMAVGKNEGKPSKTYIYLKDTTKHFSFVEAEPITGRTHQIRVHLASIGHPILGDKVYGKSLKMPNELVPPQRHMLHSFFLSFFHPATHERVEFEARMPDDMLKTWKYLKEND